MKISHIIGSLLVSLGIAFTAWGIAFKTDIMMKDIAFSSLYETMGVFSNERLGLRLRLELLNKKLIIYNDYKYKSNEFKLDFTEYKIYHSYSIWKCKTYFDRVLIFKEYFRKKEEETLIHQVDCFIQDLCEGRLFFIVNYKLIWEIANNYIGNLQDMYDTILTFDKIDRTVTKNKLREERILNNIKFLKGIPNTSPIIGF